MLWLLYFAFKGIVGVSFAVDGDINCYTQKFSVCALGKTELCSSGVSISDCVSNSARSCSMINDTDVKSFLHFLNDKACKEGTLTNKRYTAHWHCIMQASDSSGCTNGLLLAAMDLRHAVSADEIMSKSAKLACKFSDKIETCTYSNVKDSCGNEAEAFIKEHRNSGINQLSNRFCDYVNDVSRISFHVSIWVLQGAILIFIFRWSLY